MSDVKNTPAKSSKKLTLSKETVTELTPTEQDGVVSGLAASISNSCGTPYKDSTGLSNATGCIYHCYGN